MTWGDVFLPIEQERRELNARLTAAIRRDRQTCRTCGHPGDEHGDLFEIEWGEDDGHCGHTAEHPVTGDYLPGDDCDCHGLTT